VNAFVADAQQFLPLLLQGAVVTVLLTICTLILSTLLGFVWALLRMSRVAVVSTAARYIINVIRGIPILVQLYYIYFVLPDWGIKLDPFQAGFIGLGIAYSAYQAEIFRAGLESVDKGLIEAAHSLGMGKVLTMRRLILPLAVRVILPPYGNVMIMILKDTSIASTITVAELSHSGQLIALSTFKNTVVYTLVALLYLAMSLPLSKMTSKLERRFAQR